MHCRIILYFSPATYEPLVKVITSFVLQSHAECSREIHTCMLAASIYSRSTSNSSASQDACRGGFHTSFVRRIWCAEFPAPQAHHGSTVPERLARHTRTAGKAWLQELQAALAPIAPAPAPCRPPACMAADSASLLHPHAPAAAPCTANTRGSAAHATCMTQACCAPGASAAAPCMQASKHGSAQQATCMTQASS